MEVKYEMKTTGNMETLDFTNVVVRLDNCEIVDRFKSNMVSRIKIIDKNETFCNVITKVKIIQGLKGKYFIIKIPDLLSNKSETINRNKVVSDLIEIIQTIVNSDNFDKDIKINYSITKEV